jgi:hypothetical protein
MLYVVFQSFREWAKQYFARSRPPREAHVVEVDRNVAAGYDD